MNLSQLTEILEEIGSQTNIIDLIVCAAGVFVLVLWLLKTSLGTKALDDAPPRRNNMPPLYAIIPLFMWILTASILLFIKERALTDLPDWQEALADNLIMCLGVAPAIATGLMIARRCFARRLKGLGLDPKTIPRDLGAGLLNLLAVMPAVLAAIILTILAGKLIAGPGFEIPRHKELQEIMAYPQWQVRAMILITTIVVVPFTEELVFRGMFQTLLRSYIVRPTNRRAAGLAAFEPRDLAFGGPWPAIIVASFIFVIFHEDTLHWPALFVLALCLGYAYEKSGSLFRPIFIHSLFNALSVLGTLNR
jgi:membrane protease YdiL (CAAX protease family)